MSENVEIQKKKNGGWEKWNEKHEKENSDTKEHTNVQIVEWSERSHPNIDLTKNELGESFMKGGNTGWRYMSFADDPKYLFRFFFCFFHNSYVILHF